MREPIGLGLPCPFTERRAARAAQARAAPPGGGHSRGARGRPWLAWVAILVPTLGVTAAPPRASAVWAASATVVLLPAPRLPSVLYDTSTDWELFTAEADLSVRGPTGARETATQVITISASLGYAPPGTQAKAGPSEAWLVVRGSTAPFFSTAQDVMSMDIAYTRPLSGSDVTLTLPGGHPVAAKVTGGSRAGHALFDGDYYWQVPATTRSGTLDMELPPLVATTPATSSVVRLRAKLSAPVQLDFPAPSSTPVGSPTALPTGPGVAARTTSLPLLAVLLGLAALVVVAGAAAFVVVSKRRPFLSWAFARPQPGAAQSRARGDGTVPLAADEGPGYTAAPGAGASAPRPSADASVTPVSAGITPLAEGAVLQITGQVRLDPLAQPPADPSGAQHVPASSAGSRRPTRLRPPPAPGRSGAWPGKVLVPVPTAPTPLPNGAKELQVLGQPRLFAEPGGVLELGWPELELLARLALEPGRVFTSEELRADIGGAKETDWAPSTLWTRASSLRRVVGAEHVPSSREGGYRAKGIGTDVARFESALARAKAERAGAAGHLAEALSLLRGAPFAGVPAGTFSWAHGAGGLATRLANAAFDAAVELARSATAGQDAALAVWAIGKGRLIALDDNLWDELEIQAAAASPERSALALTWANVKERYRAKGKEVPRELVADYRRLRGGAGSGLPGPGEVPPAPPR